MSEIKKRRILVVGCGDLGSRHLQAISALEHVDAVDIVDPRAEALGEAKRRLIQVTCPDPEKYRFVRSLDEAQIGADLCIVATQAEGRCQLVMEIAKTKGCSNFILEKLVGQSVGEIEALFEFCETNNISCWVNCQTRAYPFHKRVKSKISPSDPVIFTVVGGNHGLATNGIHNLDLFSFYDESGSLVSLGSSIDPLLHPSKRGSLVYDLSGSFSGVTGKGSRFSLIYSGSHSNSEQLSISTPTYRCIVDHIHRWAVESSEDSDWAWHPVFFGDENLVSNMTQHFAEDILTQGTCDLPTLGESLISHRFIFNEVKPVLVKLLGYELELCPVT